MDRQTEQLVKELSKAEGGNKEKIKAELEATIDKQFEARQKRNESDIAVLEEQVKKLRDVVHKREQNRREIVAKRLEQLVREADGLGW